MTCDVCDAALENCPLMADRLLLMRNVSQMMVMMMVMMVMMMIGKVVVMMRKKIVWNYVRTSTGFKEKWH